MLQYRKHCHFSMHKSTNIVSIKHGCKFTCMCTHVVAIRMIFRVALSMRLITEGGAVGINCMCALRNIYLVPAKWQMALAVYFISAQLRHWALISGTHS